jgi:hypothetical protein
MSGEIGEKELPCEQEVEQLVVLDAVLADKAVCVDDHRNKHVSWEFINFKQVEEDDEQLVEGIFHLSIGVGGEVLTVIVFDPRNAQV